MCYVFGPSTETKILMHEVYLNLQFLALCFMYLMRYAASNKTINLLRSQHTFRRINIVC
jgi:hypothetical protein